MSESTGSDPTGTCRKLRKPLDFSRMKRGPNRERESSRLRSQRFTGHLGGANDGGRQSTSPRTRGRCESMPDQHCTSSSGWRVPLAGELWREGFRRTPRRRSGHRCRSRGLLDCQGASGPVTRTQSIPSSLIHHPARRASGAAQRSRQANARLPAALERIVEAEITSRRPCSP